jgi:signal transduction histidine kinase
VLPTGEIWIKLKHQRKPTLLEGRIKMEKKPQLNISREEMDELVSSFSSFNQVTQKLYLAYREMEGRFGDLTLELKETNDKLKHMEQEMMRVKTLAALGEMAAVVAHEVKNPLGGIRGFAELLDRDLTPGDPRKRLVKKIMEGVETLDRIVLSLLDYTKPIKLNPHRVEMEKFIDEVINFFEMDNSRKKTGIRIKKEYPPDEIRFYVDKEQFRQVLLNLLHNAVQAMPQGGEITVALNREAESSDLYPNRKNMLVLDVSDMGMGMSKTTQEKLFTPFFTTKEQGTGLGLSTVKKIVEAHQGDIRVKSEPGKGTSVRIRLPMS